MGPLVVKHGFSTTASFFLSFFAILSFGPEPHPFIPTRALMAAARRGRQGWPSLKSFTNTERFQAIP
jgi:hypothetical protein